MGMNFFFVGVSGIFHARDDLGLKRVTFFEQLVDAFGICLFNIGQSLQVSGLSAGTGS